MGRCPPPPRALGFSREQSARPNHHAIIYRRVENSRPAVLVPAPSRTNLGQFFFPVTTLNNFLYLATPQHSAVSIHQVDWPDTLGRIAPHPSPSCSHPMEVSWTSGNCRDYPSNQPPFANEPTSNRSSHRQ